MSSPSALPSRLSYSAISAYLYCPRHFRFRYVDRVPSAGTSPAAAFGTGLHRTIQACLVAKAIGEPYDPVASWKLVWPKVVEEEQVAWNGDLPQQYDTEGLRIVDSREVRDKVLDAIDLMVDAQGPVVERRIDFTLPGVGVPIIGFIDLVDVGGVSNDIKTSRVSWTQEKAQNELQPLFYLTALNQAGLGHLNPDNRFRHVNIVRGAKGPKVQVFETRRTYSEMLWMAQLCADVWNAIVKGVYPTNPTGWKCDPKFCEFWHLCRGRLL